MNMDKMIGDEYDKGLNKLKTVSEKEAANPVANIKINEISVGPKMYVGMKKTVSFDKISDFFAESMPHLFGKAQGAHLQLAGPPSGLYYSYDEKNMTTEVAAAAPVTEIKGKIAPLESFTVKGGKALEMD